MIGLFIHFLRREPPKTLTVGEVIAYQSKLLERYALEPEVPLPYPSDVIQTLIRFLAHWAHEEGYRVQAGDVASVETYNFTAPNVAPVWLVRERIVRDGTVIIWRNSWTENELKYLQGTSGELLARTAIGFGVLSPATIYITAPDGTHAGYDPSTGELVRGFPVVVSDHGDEPFCVLIPHPTRGVYLINVVPEPNALPTDTYSLVVVVNGQTMVLAQDVQIQNIPSQPYEFESKLNYADFDNNGDVDFYDYAAFALRWMGADCHYPDWCEGKDLDYSGRVDFMDLSIFTDNWLWEIIPADFNIDGEVEFTDYAVFANRWMAGNCAESAWCNGADLNKSGSVDLLDLAEFAELWLEGR